MSDTKTGKVVIKSIPTKIAKDRVGEYLLSRTKNSSAEQISALLDKKPLTLASRISAVRGEAIARELRDLGAIAVFEEEGEAGTGSAYGQTGENANEAHTSTRTKSMQNVDIKTPSRIEQLKQLVSWGIPIVALIAVCVLWTLKASQQGPREVKPATGVIHSQAVTSAVPKNTPLKDNTFNRLQPVSAKSPSVMSVQPKDMLEAYLYQYRFRPDSRLLEVFSTLLKRYGQLAGDDSSSFEIGEIKSDGIHVLIPLLKNGSMIREMKLQLPLEFAEVRSSLADMLRVIDDQTNKAPVPARVPTPGEEQLFQNAVNNIGMVDARYIVSALSSLEHLWQNGFEKARLLKAAARAYATLLLTSEEEMSRIEDGLAVEALTCLVLARHIDQAINTESEEFLIAMSMGYRTHADAIASKLEQEPETTADQILSAYMRRDLKSLQQFAEEYKGILAPYLLTRHYREMGLFKEAEAAAAELLSNFPALYPSVIENINVGPLNLAKALSLLYPLDILENIEKTVSPETIIDLQSWREKVTGFSGDAPASNISFASLSNLLAEWEPYSNPQAYQFIIDADRLKDIYRLLYIEAVYYRHNVLFKRWGVTDMAKSFADSFGMDDNAPPLVMLMQGQVYAKLGDQVRAVETLSSFFRHPESTGKMVYQAFFALEDPLGRLSLLPDTADMVDGRPTNRVLMGYLLMSGQEYELAAKYLESGLSQDPYHFLAYRYLASVKGSPAPFLDALQRSPNNFQLLEQAGQYLAEQADRASLEKALEYYERALELAPSRASLVWEYAAALSKLELYDEAMDVLNGWLEEYGGDGLDTVFTKSERAGIYLKKGQPDLALASLDNDIDSYQAGVIQNVAKAYEKLGDVDKADMYYQKAVKRYMTEKDIIADAAGFYWRQDRFEQAAALIAYGRTLSGGSGLWYVKPFTEAFREKTDEELLEAVSHLQKTGAPPLELETLGSSLADLKRYNAAFTVLSGLKTESMIGSLEFITLSYKIMLEWQGPEKAIEYLHSSIFPNQRGPLMMVLYDQGMYDTIAQEIGDPDEYHEDKEFMWLQLLIAWIFQDKQPGDLESRIRTNYARDSSDYYHAIGRYLLGSLPLQDLFSMIRTKKQRCEFAYYIGLKARIDGNFTNASYWYNICQQTLQMNNGEFQWATRELYHWAQVGLANRHRLATQDVEMYRKRELEKIKPQSLPSAPPVDGKINT